MDSCRPSIDSALSVSRIGSNAQCKLIKIISTGLKNELTNYRIMDLSTSSISFLKLLTLNQIYFQDHLYLSSISFSVILIILYRNGILFNRAVKINRLLLLLCSDYMYSYYIVFLIKSSYSIQSYYWLLFIISSYLLVFIVYFSWFN